MSDLVQIVKDGIVQQNNSQVKKSDGSKLDKDAFLQLLTTQMKYQDPLNPSSNTEYVAQLATFSQLEQIQNLSTATTNSQAFSLVGKSVIVKSQDATGNPSYISGKVDYISISNGKAQLSINGSLFGLDKLDSIIDEQFIKNQNAPKITSPVTLNYDGTNPKDLEFKVNMGKDEGKATDLALAINGYLIDASKYKLEGDTVTIDKSVFKNLENGTYKITVAFDDAEFTVVRDKVTLQVQNAITSDDDPIPEDETETEETDGNEDGSE